MWPVPPDFFRHLPGPGIVTTGGIGPRNVIIGPGGGRVVTGPGGYASTGGMRSWGPVGRHANFEEEYYEEMPGSGRLRRKAKKHAKKKDKKGKKKRSKKY